MAFKGAHFTYSSVKNAFDSGAAMKVAFLGVLIIPVIFAGFYLTAFFDPYARLNTVAVAVVNEDAGAEISGETRNIGNDVCDNLRDETDGLQWHFVTADQARTGMEQGKYYMSCTIPKNFSERIASADKDNPQRADLIITYDQSKNMLASQIGQTVWNKVQQSMNASINEEYWKNAFTKMNEAGDGLKEAADGAGQLADGLGTAADGSITITYNLRTLQDGSATLTDGLNTLADGSAKVNDGVQSLADGMKQVSGGSSALNDGLGDLKNQSDTLTIALPQATEQLVDGADKVNKGAKLVAQQVKDAADDIKDKAEDIGDNLTTTGSNLTEAGQKVGSVLSAIAEDYPEEAAKLRGVLGNINTAGANVKEAGETLESMSSSLDPSGIGQLVDGTGTLYTSMYAFDGRIKQIMSDLAGGVKQLAAGSSQLNTGVQAVTSGANQLADNTPALADGAASAAAGSAKITDGAGQLADGSQTLSEGLVTAQDGSKELQDGLADGASQLSFTNSQIDAKAGMMNEPINLTEEKFTTVENYGTGFSPFFLGLAIWVGCLFNAFVFKPLNKRLCISGANPVLVAFVNYVPMALFAIVQAVVAQAFVQFVVGAHIGNVAAYYGLGILCALVFTALMQFLVAAFNYPGRFIAVIILTLQLTSSAGTFPVEMTPPFFQAINPFMPMTYFVDGMRQIMTGLNSSVAVTDAGILAMFGVVCFALTSFIAYRRRTVTMTQIHPLIDLA